MDPNQNPTKDDNQNSAGPAPAPINDIAPPAQNDQPTSPVQGAESEQLSAPATDAPAADSPASVTDSIASTAESMQKPESSTTPEAPTAPATPESPATTPEVTPTPQQPASTPEASTTPADSSPTPTATDSVAPATTTPPSTDTNVPASNVSPAQGVPAQSPTTNPMNQPMPGKKKMSGKKLIIILVIALLNIAVIGGALWYFVLNKSGLALTEYSPEDGSYSIMVPEGWEADDSASIFVPITQFTAPEEDELAQKAELGVIGGEIDVEGASISEEDYFAEIDAEDTLDIGEDDGSGQEYASEIISKERVEINGKPALLIHIQIENSNDEEGVSGKGAIAFIYVNENTNYAVAMDSPDEYSAFIDSFDKIINSFKVNE